MQFYKNKWIIYIVIFFHHLIPAYTIERLYWQERGMSIDLVVYCEMIYAITIVALEFPSGMIADKLGRKKLIVLSNFFAAAAFAILLPADSFWYFAVSVFLSGIGTAFASGAYNALLYDSLAAANKSEGFEKALGRINAVDFSASLIAALSGSFLAVRFGFELNYLISLISVILALLFCYLLKEPPCLTNSRDILTFKAICGTAFLFFKNHLSVLKVLVNAAVIGACISYIYEFWQLYLKGFGFPVEYFGIASAAFSVAVIPCSLLSSNLLNRWKNKTIIVYTSFACGAGILFTAFTNGIAGIAGLAVSCGAAALINPVALGYLHHHADDKARATIESAVSLIERLFSMAIGLLFGFVSMKYTVTAGFYLIGAVIVFISAGLLFSFHPSKKELP